MKDSFYTPTSLAQTLVNYIPEKNIKTVADFCVGDGELLRAAVNRWPDAECYGIDISKEVIELVKKSHPSWKLDECDFFADDQRNKLPDLNIKDGFDLILLNPPFSCIGAAKRKISIDEQEFEASTAMAFLAIALKYMSKNGCVFAILPNSAAYSQKDKKIWSTLVSKYKLVICEEPRVNQFNGCSPNIILVSLNVASIPCISKRLDKLPLTISQPNIFRGKISMHKIGTIDSNGFYLVHSTNIYKDKLQNLSIKIINRLSQVTGPAVLLPRVGSPNPQKICVITKKETYVLSDCIIAVKTSSLKDAQTLKKSLTNNWNEFSNLYKGTGAKYITVERLKDFLNIPTNL